MSDIFGQIQKLFKSKTVKTGAVYTLFSFINSGIGFILLLLLAGYLIPADYGYLNLYNNFVAVFTIFVTLGTAAYVSIVYFRKSREEFRQVLLIVFVIAAVVTGVILAIIALFSKSIEGIVGIPQEFIYLASFVCFFHVFTDINLNIWRLEEKPVKYGVYSLSSVVLNFILTYLLVIAMHKGWVGRVYAQVLVELTFFLISVGFLFYRGYLRFTRFAWPLFLETLLYGLPIVPHSASFWLKQGLDRYIINYFHDVTAVGLYSFALNFATIISIVGSAFNSNNSVYMFKQLARGYNQARPSMERITRLMIKVFGVVLVIVLLGTIVGVPIILPKYAGCVPYLFPVCLGAFFQNMYLLYVNYLFFYKKTKQLMYITFSTGILQMLLSLWLTRYSVLYTAYISCFITLLTMLLVRHKSLQILRKEMMQ
jgi:O-antigen/teichoic acid export membrane protein